jgi:DNA-nicking Smr family endonuclease
MKSKMKKEARPFWLEPEEESFVEIFDEELFDQECLDRASAKKESVDNSRQGKQAKDSILLPQKELDLHGCNSREAESRIESFIQACHHERLVMMRIITGKGLHSSGAPVLPDVAEHKLYDLKEKKIIKSFYWEKKYKSTSGAIIVLL